VQELDAMGSYIKDGPRCSGGASGGEPSILIIEEEVIKTPDIKLSEYQFKGKPLTVRIKEVSSLNILKLKFSR
jgi:hypothetical protein